MHEYHIVEDLVAQVLKKAEVGGARKVTRVTLVLGAQCGLEESSVRLYFDNCAQGTIAQGAELLIKPVQAKLVCRKCGLEFERKGGDINCPACCSLGFLNQTGKEFYIENIEIES